MAFANSGQMLNTVARLTADSVIADSNGTAKVLYIELNDSATTTRADPACGQTAGGLVQGVSAHRRSGVSRVRRPAEGDPMRT